MIIFHKHNHAQTLVILLRQLAGMLTAGIPIARCFEILEKMQANANLRAALYKIKNRLLAGFALHDSLRHESVWFDTFSCRLVHLGEQTGKLDRILLALATHHEKRANWRRSMQKALFYPCVLLITALILSFCMFVFVIPKFADLFADMLHKLPLLTRLIFACSSAMVRGLPLLFGGLVLSILFLIYIFRRKKVMLLRLPLLTNYLRAYAVARFTRNLAIALAAGIPIIEALKLSAGFGDSVLENAVTELRTAVSAGHHLHQAIAATEIFPVMLQQMVRVGEEAGSLDNMLDQAAGLLEAELNARMEHFTQLLEPLIMCVLGVLIGGLVIGMYLPVFNLGSAL
jgi:type IV pilus assembly protein PilC